LYGFSQKVKANRVIKLLTLVGARPQFIKAAAVSRAIRKHFSSRIGSGSHAEQTAKILTGFEKIIIDEDPDAVLLYGDTNSTLAGCLASAKLHVPVIHVEAGVRMYNKTFPEEVNRLVCDHLSSVLFVPSDAGINSLIREGFDIERDDFLDISPDNPVVFRCGDIMYDNTLFFSSIVEEVEERIYAKHQIPSSDFVLVTAHRPSNVDDIDALHNLFTAFNEIYKRFGKSVVIPLHPRTALKIEENIEISKLASGEGIFIIEPASFIEMIALEKHADLVITDSGGVQKEAYFMEKPCLIMLFETPWPELVDSGNALLVGNDKDKIINGVKFFLDVKENLKYPQMYGDGRAAEYICEKIIEIF